MTADTSHDKNVSALLQAISVGVPVAAGFLVSMLGQKEILTWYRGLNKPSWQPPAFLFGTLGCH